MNYEITGLSKSYPGHTVFKNLNLSLKSGDITCLLGPSGCGKTTLLHLLAGTVKADSGKVEPDTAGNVGYLFQESRLLPWMTVLDNAAYLMCHSLSRAERRAKASRLLTRVGLEGFENHFPGELSGGMARRVALARMIGKEASLVLMDEPFSSVDAELKHKLMELTRKVIKDENRTVLCVTHDLSVAEKIGDRIIRMENTADGAVLVD